RDRTIELGYLFPILPLRWMEHYYGDHDNALISMDIRYRPINNLSLYGEFLIDDETFSVSWTKSYANKWGFLFGLHNTNFLTISDLAFNFEYSRVEPYVYTHRFHINRYMNLDSYLGNPYGPDSETIDLKLKYFYNLNTNITLGYTRANIGEPLWGLPDEPDDYKIENKVFLRGTVEKINYYYAELSYFYNKYIGVDLFYSHTDIINYNHNLPVYDDNWYGDYVAGTYTDYDDYYDQEILPDKQYQVYSNNTFRITLNLMFKNYLF
ncbi:MAG: hypothetical protein KAS62_00465, partial [Candidatus Delongbacteria bacterium]|nr:hypothetical protein [Candidatus Delongbacteria bacterium]